MSKIFLFLNRKAMPLFLAAVMLFDLSAFSFAQALPKGQKQNYSLFPAQDKEQKVNYVLQNKYKQQAFGFGDFEEHIKNVNNAVERAKEIRDVFKSAASAQEGNNVSNAAPSALNRQDFAAQYKAAIGTEYQKGLKAVSSEKQKALLDIQTAVNADPQELAARQAALDAWEKENILALGKWQSDAIKSSSARYSVYLKNYNAYLLEQNKNRDEELEHYVASLTRELMAIYKKYPSVQAVKTYLLEVSPTILLLKKDGKDFFTDADKNILKDLYLKELRANNSCDLVVKSRKTTWTTVNSPTVGTVGVPSTHTERGLRSKEGCDIVFTSLTGLGLIGEGREDAQAIVDFMEKNAQTTIAVPSMLAGASALMAMGEYGPLRGFVASSITKENNGQNTFPSLSDLVDIIAYNRNYLGEVSKYTQYPLPNGAMGNGWEDLAYLLLEDNTKESREILTSFAINCTVFPGDFLVDDSMSCNGIRPFLLGTVLGSHDMANNYQPQNSWTEARQYFISTGQVITQTDEQINNAIKRNNWARSIFNNYAKKQGVGKGAVIARWLYKSDMGDVDTATKQNIDAKIYKKYGSELGHNPATAISYYKKGDAVYRSKETTRQVVYAAKGIATLGDIALLIWGVKDVSKGIKILRSMHRAVKMARAGATVAQRAVMLRQMGTAKNLISMRRFARNFTAGARMATGVKMPAISVDSFVTGMPKPVLQLASLPKYKAPVVAAQLTSKTALGAALLPAKRKYQEIYLSVKGKDPFAVPLPSASKTLDGSKLVDAAGNTHHYSKFELRKDGLLEVDGVLQDKYKVQMPVSDLDFFISRLKNQGFYDYLYFDATLNDVASKTKYIQKFKTMLPSFMKPKNVGNSPISLELYDPLGRPMNAFIRVENTYGRYADFAATRRLTLRGRNLFSGDKPVDLGLSLSKGEFTKLAQKEINFSRLPELNLIYTKSKPVNPAAFSHTNSALNQAKLYASNGKAVDYNDLSFNKEGFLLVDGEVQKVFKVNMQEKEFASFVAAARKQGYADNIEIKLAIPGAKRSFKDWGASTLTSKEKLFDISIPVYDNFGNLMNVTAKMDSKFDLHKAFDWVNGITFRGGRFVSEDGSLLNVNISLPKNQMLNMAKKGVDFTKMPPLDIHYTKSKMGPLYLNMALSFSAASSGLYFPLTKDPYKDHVSNWQVSLITIGLPYGFSLLSPFASGVVSKFGAAKTQMFALSMAAGGLGVASIAGYRGNATLLKDENGNILYDDKGAPKVRASSEALPLWPLYTAAAVTGFASALGRSSLSVLNKQLEIKNSMLKGMAMKNIGGLAMVIPPAAISLMGGETDFSAAYPVLAGVSMFTVGWMKFSKYANNINKVPGYTYSFMEGVKGFKVMGNSSVLPYVAANAMFSGFEGQALYKTAAGMSKENVGGIKFSDRPSAQKNLVAFASGAAIAVVPAITRWFPPKNIKNFSPHILGAVASSATGGLIMATQKDPTSSLNWVGAGLVGFGTANMYIFLQKSMLSKLAKNYELNPQKFYSVKNGEKIFKSYRQVETEALTAYTTSNLGLAVGQQAASAYADHRVERYGDSQWDANRRSMWIPEAMLVTGAAVAVGTKIVTLPKLTKLPVFTMPLPKLNFTLPTLPTGAFGIPYAAYVAGQISKGNYPLKSQLSVPAISLPQIKLNTLPNINKINITDPAVDAPAIKPLPQGQQEQQK